ncbi:class II glutamine amidotransferase [Thiotrichales bacterium 19S11-10]|nr:class II glutamine amidotransferase [Thiotrichales bacterium 19S11-10]
MCRFVAYLGKKSELIGELVDKPENSLINQSREAREGRLGLNADGFGLAWYGDCVTDNLPGVFKSTQPAWNDNNLKHLAAKLRSKCFLAHVRASTIGDVVLNNCHPFTYNCYSFVHNGTIRNFDKIRRHIINELDDELFSEVKAQTDSEHLFFLIMQYLKNDNNMLLEGAVKKAFEKIILLQKDDVSESFSRMNIAITDGKKLMATRYVSKDEDPLSLYYAAGKHINTNDELSLIEKGKKTDAIIVASEPLSDYVEEWNEVPENHYILIDLEQKHMIVEPF